MKKFNRILSFLMALALLFHLAPAAFADTVFTDTDSVVYEEAKELLAALDILPEGNADPTGEISREEAARMLTRTALGGQYTDEEIAAMYGKYEKPYSDISDEQWREGHIAYVAKTGIIAGRSSDTFDPGGTVAGMEIARMLLVALGLDDSQQGYIEASDEPITREEAAEMLMRALSALPNYGNKTLAEQNYGMKVPELQQKIAEGEGELLIMGETHYYDASQLDSNKSFDNYTDRYQATNQDAARTVVEADLIPTYNHQRLYNLYVNAPYTWSDAAQLIATLELGEEEAAKLEDPVEYCRSKGYIPEGQERQHPLTGIDLMKILSTLMGSKVWLESSAGQFASLYGLLEGTSGMLSLANTDLETMEDHTSLNQLLAQPLNRDNAMTILYNFLKAAIPDGEGTVAEHFGVNLEDYRYQRRNPPGEEGIFYTDTVIPAGTTVNVSVDNRGLITVIQADAEVDGTDGNLTDDVAVNTYAVQVDSPITVETLQHIITEITKYNTNGAPTTIFRVDDASTWGNVDGYSVTVKETENGSVFSGSSVTYVPTGGGDYHIFTQESDDFTAEFMDEVQQLVKYGPTAGDGLVGLPEASFDLTNAEDETLITYDDDELPLLNPGEYELWTEDSNEGPEPEGDPDIPTNYIIPNTAPTSEPPAEDPPVEDLPEGTADDPSTQTPSEAPAGEPPVQTPAA